MKTYREADTYIDQATYSRSRAKRGEGVIRTRPIHEMSLAVDKPGRLRFMSKQVSTRNPKNSFDVAANGDTIRSAAGSLAGQIHETAAPEKLTPHNFIPEPNIRNAALEVSLENIYPQLTIMLSDKEIIEDVFPEATNFELIEDDKLNGRICHRVVLSSNDGNRILWIDADTFALLRMELPIESQMPQLDPRGVFSKYSIWIDYNQPNIGTEIDPMAFDMEIPAGVRRVRELVPPPATGPQESLGKQIGEFSFTTLDGQEITPTTVKGKVVALDFWLNSCPPCQRQTPILEEVYQKFKDNDKFVFYAVNANLPKHNLSNESVESLFRSWGGSFEVLRDLKETSDFQMGIRRYPHMVVLSPDGRVQFDEGGEHTDAQPLTDLIQKLLDGADPAAEVLAEYQQELDKFQSALEEATIEAVESEIQN